MTLVIQLQNTSYRQQIATESLLSLRTEHTLNIKVVP